MATIAVLDQNTIDKIAAGEVVERPCVIGTYVNTVSAASACNAYHSHVCTVLFLLRVCLKIAFRQMCCISAAICFFVSSRLLLLSMTESQKDRNTSSLTWLSMMLRVFSLVYPRFALSRSKRLSLDV